MSRLQERTFAELADKSAFEAARAGAYDYLDGVFGQRVTPTADALAALASFDEPFPAIGAPGASLVERLHLLGSPATMASAGGRYFGLVTGGALPASIAARWLGDAWDQNAALYRLSPVAAKLESVCEKWLKTIFRLGDECVAGFVSGSSTAILCGLAAGRHRALANRGWDVNARGMNGAPSIRVVASRQAHATVLKAIAMLGLGTDNIEYADVDDQGRVIVDRVPALDDATILILQAGNVNGGAFDPLEPLCRQAEAAGAWVHIDGAFGLWAAASSRLAQLTQGMERAHSWSVDGHKTLNTPYGNGVILCRDAEALTAAMQASGSYIAWSDERDGMLYTPEMSRRARAIELWAALAYLGADGLDELVWQLYERTAQMAAALRGDGFAIANEIVFNQILVDCGKEAETARMIEHLQNSGECWVGGATWFGRPVIRVSICSWATTAADVVRTAAAFARAREAGACQQAGAIPA